MIQASRKQPKQPKELNPEEDVNIIKNKVKILESSMDDLILAEFETSESEKIAELENKITTLENALDDLILSGGGI